MLTEQQIKEVEQKIAAGEPRVFITEIDGVKMVIKGQEGARAPWRYNMLRFCSTIFREPLLMPASVQGDEHAQAIEVARLRTLHAAGVPVPELLHVAENWIALSYLGQTTLRSALFDGEKPASYYWEKALAAILDTHKRGQNLSQVFARNAMFHEDKVVFIDFEDDPATYMGLTNAQGRDWMFFLFSSIWMLEISRQEAVDLFWKYLQQDNPEVQKALLHTSTSVGWLRHLPKKRKPWGRDVIAVQAFGQVLYELKKKNIV